MSSSPTIQFFDHALPSLEAGSYEILAEQKIEGLQTDSYFQPIRQQFEVRAPQFALSSADIHAIYPPAQSNGIYGRVLPYIVLNTKDLPWERSLTAKDRAIPWMTLLLFTDDELRIDPQTNTPMLLSTVGELLTADRRGQVLKPAIDPRRLSTEVLASTCQSIILSAATFRSRFARLTELRYLTHVRQANTDGQEMARDSAESGWFSAVMANRFPSSTGKGGAKGARNWALLLSLEGYAPYVENPTFPKKPGGTEEMDLQLVVLASWSFICTPEGKQSFAQLAKGFVAQQGSEPGRLLLRLPAAGSGAGAAQQEALERLRHGYVPLSYRTATGEDTYAWYRGPFTPVVAQPVPKAVPHYTSASQATIYVQASGIFDLSYAAAWEAGRALALADRSFATALLALRRQSHQLINTLVDRRRSPHLKAPDDLEQLLQSGLVRKRFDQLIEQGLADQLTALFGQANGSTGAGAPPVRSASPDDLDRTAVQSLHDLMADPAAQTLVRGQAQQALKPVVEWLAQLNLLTGLPFNHLVPDQRMLPVESIRFFYIDQHWLSALTDGALSIGIESSRDIALHQILTDVITEGIRAAMPNAGVRAGLLIRSELVAGWPGLVVKGLQKEKPLPALRMQRLSPQVLLCLFSDLPDRVALSEPLQGLRFGLEDGDVIALRALSSPVGRPLGRDFPAGATFAQFMRPDGGRVLRINDGAGSLVPALAQALGVSSIGPAAFAIQMVKAPEQQSFVLPAEVRHG